MFQKLLIPCIYSGVVLAVPPAAGTIVELPLPFSSPLTETWESFPLGPLTGEPAETVFLMDGFATATGAHLVTYIPGKFGPNHFGLGPFTAKVHDGNQGFGVSTSRARVAFAFNTPIVALGGFWGISSGAPPVAVAFLDAQDNLIGQTEFSYGQLNNDGTLEWHGWATDVPATKVVFSGASFVNDSLRVAQVPETTASLLLSLGIAVSLSTRRRRQADRIHSDH